MDVNLSDVESLTLCNFCKHKFNATDMCPKLLQCKHYFCLRCIESSMIQGVELSCVLCLKRQEVKPGEAATLPTHKSILSLANHLTLLHINDDDKISPKGCNKHGQSWTLWCHGCHKELCHACNLIIDHPGHHVTPISEAWRLIASELQSELTMVTNLLERKQRLSAHKTEFQLQVLEACVAVKSSLESDIATSCAALPELREAIEIIQQAQPNLLGLSSLGDIQSCLASIQTEKNLLETRCNDLSQQYKMEEAVKSTGELLDFPSIAAILASDSCISPGANGGNIPPLLLLTNYCMYQLFSKCITNPPPYPVCNITRNINPVHPMYYFNIEINQAFAGRFVIETRPDLAPKMAKNFEALCVGETGPSYKNCSVFQCWSGESIITGDFETNNGRGGHSIFENGFFMPEETKLLAVRGAVGMRRSQKKHDGHGLVGSQFRIILRDMHGFTGIFGHVVDGIDVVAKIASCGDHTGKPNKSIEIVSCGKV